MIPSRRHSNRRAGRRLRRYLGLPRLSGRSVLLIFLLFVGLAYLSVTVVTDFFETLVGYTPEYYDLKDLKELKDSKEFKEFKRK